MSSSKRQTRRRNKESVNPLDHPICFASPERLTTSTTWHEHIPFGMFLIDLLRPKVLVELGTHAGDSYCAFCQAVKTLSLDTQCYAVDTWKGDPHAGFYDVSVLEELRAYHDPLYGSFSSLIQSTFDDALRHFADSSIDLLHIDGYHTYKAVKHDFDSWLPKMSVNGVILLHDTNVHERDFGIEKFWTEVKQRFPHFAFLHGYGLGLLAVDKIASRELEAILTASHDDTLKLRNFFFQLGRKISLKDEADALHRALGSGQEKGIDTTDREYSFGKFSGSDQRQTDSLQLFWDDGNGFSEANSLKQTLVTNGQKAKFIVRLPADALRQIRLDPGNRPAHIEIDRIELIASENLVDVEPDGEVLAYWSPANSFTGLVAGSGITRLRSQETVRFFCWNRDPQLLLTNLPDRMDSRPWLLRMTISVSAHYEETLGNELQSLLSELADADSRIAESLKQLSEERSATQLSAARLSSLQQDLQEQQEEFAVALEKKEQQMKTRSDELAEAHSAVKSLTDEVREKEQSVHALRAALVEKEDAAIKWRHEIVAQSERFYAERKQLVRQVEEREQRLRLELESTQQQLQETGTALQTKDRELQHILHTLGWRLLSRYGRIKYGFLLPAGSRIRSLFNLFRSEEYRPQLQPINNLLAVEGTKEWQSTDRDPQFNLCGEWPKGPTEVLLEIQCDGEAVGPSRLYVDRGTGYSESDSYDLGDVGRLQRSFVELGPEVIALRLDPFESAGTFQVKRLTLRRARGRTAGESRARDKGQSSAFNLGQFAQFARVRRDNFRQKHGHSPGVFELPGAVLRTVRAWWRVPHQSVTKSGPQTVDQRDTFDLLREQRLRKHTVVDFGPRANEMRPIRTLMCSFNLNREGAPYSQFELTIRLRNTGIIDPIVYCPNKGPLRDLYTDHGIRVEIFEHPLSGVHTLPAYDRAIVDFARMILNWNVDLVYANTRQTFYAIEAAKMAGIPSIWNPRESEPWETYFDYLGPQIAARALECFGYPHKVIFVANASRESCLPLDTQKNFITIHNALNREEFAQMLERSPRDSARRELAIGPNEVMILAIGTVCERKGQLDLIEAMARLEQRTTDTLRCFIVGKQDNEYAEQLKRRVSELPVLRKSRIELVDGTSNPALYYAAADLFVCSSRIESFPRVILEAMAAGLPIITTLVFGIAEQVRKDINALCYTPGDITVLAQHIDRLALDSSRRRELAENSVRVLDELEDFEQMVRSYGSVFREAVMNGGPR